MLFGHGQATRLQFRQPFRALRWGDVGLRILVTSVPSTGHIHPMMPLVLGLQRAGHDVAWATGHKAKATIEGYGIPVYTSGAAPAASSRGTPPLPYDPSGVPARERRAIAFGGRFGAAAVRMHEDLAPIVDRFRPDLIMHDMAELAAAPIATSRGIPHVTFAFSGAPSETMLGGIEKAVAGLWSAEGLAVPSDAGLYSHLYFHRFPPAFGLVPSSVNVRFVRPVGFDGSTTAGKPDWLDSLGSDGPAVYVTLGTVVSGPDQWRTILAAMASVNVDVIATTGAQDPGEIGPIPPNVRLERYVPQSFILDRVAALISHGGAGTLLAGASHGVPQVCIPMGADQWENADALAGTGASITLEEDQRDAATIAGALERLLNGQDFAVAAHTVAAEIAALSHPNEYIFECEALVGT